MGFVGTNDIFKYEMTQQFDRFVLKKLKLEFGWLSYGSHFFQYLFHLLRTVNYVSYCWKQTGKRRL